MHGIVVAMLTPFNINGEIDLNQERKFVDFLIERKVDCLYPLGTTGEAMKLSLEERMKIAETIVDQADGRVNVYIHVGALNTKDTIKLAQHAQSIGADGVGVVTPAYHGVNDTEMEEFYCEVAGSVPELPVYMYNIPQCTTNDLSVGVAQRAAKRCSNIAGIKYSLADFSRMDEYMCIQPKLDILHGADTLYLGCRATGTVGLISGTSSAYPEPFVGIEKQWQNGNIEACRKLQYIANEYSKAMCGSQLAYLKEALRYRKGPDLGSLRKPGLPLEKEQITALRERLQALDEQYLDYCIKMCK